MPGQGALLHALELTQSPHLAAAMRRQELPSDVIVPIRLAAGCPETAWEAMQSTQLSSEILRDAARTYLQLVLFTDEGDCYRVLGVQRGASRSQMREHMRWLLEWLHPDRNSGEWESVYAERVIQAWRDAKTGVAPATPTPQPPSPPVDPLGTSRRSGRRLRAPVRWIPVPIDPPRPRFRATIGVGAAVLIVSLAVLVLPRLTPVSEWFPSAPPIAASNR